MKTKATPINRGHLIITSLCDLQQCIDCERIRIMYMHATSDGISRCEDRVNNLGFDESVL